jgi:transcriptional regulator with XRE-family HTH domain
MSRDLLERARREAGLTQEDLAARAGTSRPTLSAYEHGRKSPTLVTVERLLDRAGFELAAVPKVSFAERPMRRGRPVVVPDRLWRLPVRQALATVTLPLGVSWSRPGATYALRDRRQRARCYEIVLREGQAADLLQYVDGALLVDLWDDLVLPRDLRSEWQPVIDGSVL